jgi:hypothetical protein
MGGGVAVEVDKLMAETIMTLEIEPPVEAMV